MKPLKLRFQAFGSFTGCVEIDFDSLAPRGVFVVSGDTGTGKTTIFDAMCWALYGEMPLKDSGGVRSDHASADTETYVELTFECDGVRYVVTRRPRQLRPARRGSGMTTEQASAGLVRLSANGSHSLSTKATDTTALCKVLVGLDATQFQRVVLLPQGDFARFLLAETKERELLLGKLFGAQVFDNMVDYLKTHRNELASQIQDVEADIKAQLDNARENLARAHEALGIDVPVSLGYARNTSADSATEPDTESETDTPPKTGSHPEPHILPEPNTQPEPVSDEAAASGLTREPLDPADREELGRIREAVAEPLTRIQEQVDELRLRADQATKVHSDAEAAAARFDQALRHLAAINDLDETEHEVNAAEAAALRSKKARPVTTESTALDKALAQRTVATEARDERVAAIADHLSRLGAPPDTSSAATITAAVGDHKRVNEQQALALQAQSEATQACKKTQDEHDKVVGELEAEHAASRAAVARAREIEETELPALHKQGADPESLRTRTDATTKSILLRSALDAAQHDLNQARETEDRAATEHRQVFETFVATTAPRLAQSLVDDKPCPVCGSEVHPAPALGDDASATSSGDLEAAADAQRRAADALSRAKESVAKLRGELGDKADLSIDELEARRVESEATLAAAKKVLERIAALEQELADTRERVQRTEKRIAGLEANEANTKAKLGKAEQALATADEAAKEIDAATVQENAEMLGIVNNLVDGLDALFISAARAESSVEEGNQRFEEALDASPFDTVDDAWAALLDIDEEAARLHEAQQHRDTRNRTVAALETLDEQGVPEQRPDLEHTERAKNSAQGEYERIAGAHTTAVDNAGYCDTALARHDTLMSDSEGVRSEYDRAQRAYFVCNNGGALSMSLKRWVLTRELDHVTAAANVHLARMTAHRYSLRRRSEITDGRKSFGLDLEVFDATTGRPRSTTTLSGGEQFQASLALALGLADVVSHGGSASGKRFGALFVDEGFGSLDPKSLDDAIEALHQLHATGRMIGAITHVEAMKQQLHVGIEVKRLPDGGGSTLVVNP